MYLVDTGIWLERLLDQEQSAQVGQFLASVSTERLLISDRGRQTPAQALAQEAG